MLRAYSSSKRERRAATWLRPGPPRPSRQSEEEDGDREPLLLLEAGDISCHTHAHAQQQKYSQNQENLMITTYMSCTAALKRDDI